MAQVSVKKRVACTCVFVLYLAFSLLMSHPYLLFPHGYFETTPDYDFTDDPIHTFLPYLPVLKAQDMRHSARCIARSLATWPSSSLQTQVMSLRKFHKNHFRGCWHDAHQRSEPQFLRLLENHEREHWTIRCSHSFWFLCFARFSWLICSSDSKQRKACNRETVARQRETEERERFCDQCCRVDVREKSTERYWCESEESQKNSIRKSLRKFYSDGWDLREHLQRRAQQAIPAENSDQRKLHLNEYEMEIQNSERRNSEYALIGSQRELEPQRRQLFEANQSKLNVRNTFV